MVAYGILVKVSIITHYIVDKKTALIRLLASFNGHNTL